MERKNRMEASPLKQKVRLHTCMKLTLLMWIMVEYMLSAMNIDALAAKKSFSWTGRMLLAKCLV